MMSGAVNCSGHANVGLQFNEYFRSFNDSCFVDVSTSAAFATYTRYVVTPNNILSPNDYVPNNPQQVFINITTAAGNQPNVYLRFYYYGPVDGAYSWQIDDVVLKELEAVDVSLHGSFLFSDSVGAYHSSIANVPLAFADSIAPITLLNNDGYNAQNNFTVNAKVFLNNSQVYNQSQTV